MKYYVVIYCDILGGLEGFTHAFLGLTKGVGTELDEMDKRSVFI